MKTASFNSPIFGELKWVQVTGPKYIIIKLRFRKDLNNIQRVYSNNNSLLFEVKTLNNNVNLLYLHNDNHYLEYIGRANESMYLITE